MLHVAVLCLPAIRFIDPCGSFSTHVGFDSYCACLLLQVTRHVRGDVDPDTGEKVPGYTVKYEVSSSFLAAAAAAAAAAATAAAAAAAAAAGVAPQI
jgi:hypothetical protein